MLLAALLLCGCGGQPAELMVPPARPLPEPFGLRVAVASDLHQSPDDTSSPSAVAYNGELAEAMLWDARQQGAQILLLTGDLVSGGKPERHAALIEKLRRCEEAGLPVYVLPGNHDLSPIVQTEFAALYADFGYEEAFSRDPASLSYCVMREDCALLLLDTGGYPAGARDLPEAPERSDGEAFLSGETLQWAERMLREAEEKGLPVLCAGHYNLLSPAGPDMDTSGYYLENRERMADLLRRYRVPLYLSGHLHSRAVYEADGLTELVTEYLLGYPTGYSVLDLTAESLRYTPRRVDVDAWAAESGQSDPVLLHHAAWQQEKLCRAADENIRYMSERNPLSRRKAGQAADFFYAVMDAYWRGTLHEERETLETMPGCKPFFRCAEGYAYGWWLRDLMAEAKPQLGGFTVYKTA